MVEQILCVDDDPNILQAYKRKLRGQYQMEIARGGEEGVEMLNNQGPFAVVVSDMRMPGMNGIQFLAHVKVQSPDSVRIMLTGNADLQTAIDAVNEGNIFRFLTKPCPPEKLIKALDAGVKQYQLVNAERDLLKNTFTASIRILTEILSMVNSEALSRASRITPYVKHIAAELQLPDLWQFEVASRLSQIGCVALPTEILDKVNSGIELFDDEQRMFDSHPSIGYKLLANIPRLGKIANMIKGQREAFGVFVEIKDDMSPNDIIAIGSQIIKVALDYDQLLTDGMLHDSALHKLYSQTGEYNSQVVGALESLEVDQSNKDKTIMKLGVDDLKLGMV